MFCLAWRNVGVRRLCLYSSSVHFLNHIKCFFSHPSYLAQVCIVIWGFVYFMCACSKCSSALSSIQRRLCRHESYLKRNGRGGVMVPLTFFTYTSAQYQYHCHCHCQKASHIPCVFLLYAVHICQNIVRDTPDNWWKAWALYGRVNSTYFFLFPSWTPIGFDSVITPF